MIKTKFNFLLFFLTLLIATSCLLPKQAEAETRRETMLSLTKTSGDFKTDNYCIDAKQSVVKITEENGKITNIKTPIFFAGKKEATWCLTTENGKIKAERQGDKFRCKPYPVKVSESAECFLCPLFKVVYTAMNEVATKSFATFGQPMAFAVTIAIALSIAFMTLPHVSSFGASSSDKYLNSVLLLAFKLVVAFTLLTNSEIIYDLFITPVLVTGLDFGQAMLGNEISGAATVSSDEGLLSGKLYAKLEQYLTSLQDGLRDTRALGGTLMCEGLRFDPLPDVGMLLQGAIIFIICLVLIISFGFYLIDTVVQLGIVGALMPFLIACWPFKKTQKFTNKGLDMFMNCFFSFVCMGIVINIIKNLIVASVNNQKVEMVDVEKMEYTTKSVVEALEQGGSLDAISDSIDLFSVNFLLIVCACIFAYKFASTSSAIASKFSSGAGLGIGAQVGGMVSSIATKPAKAAMTAAGAGVKNKVGKAFGKIKEGRAKAKAAS